MRLTGRQVRVLRADGTVEYLPVVDGRTLNKTGYTELMGVRVPVGFKDEVEDFVREAKAQGESWTNGKVIVEGLAALKRERGSKVKKRTARRKRV